MKRLTTDEPYSILQDSLNMFYAKDGEAMVRDVFVEGRCVDISLNNLVRYIKVEHDLDIDCSTDDTLSETMYDCLGEGLELDETVVAFLYTATWVAAELRARLKSIEDILGDDYDIEQLRELVKAVRVESNMYDQEEIIEGCTVQILTNTATGESSVGWWKGSAEDMPGKEHDHGEL